MTIEYDYMYRCSTLTYIEYQKNTPIRSQKCLYYIYQLLSWLYSQGEGSIVKLLYSLVSFLFLLISRLLSRQNLAATDQGKWNPKQGQHILCSV
jgi:hypothetical protein